MESYLRAERAYSDAFMKPTAALQQRLSDPNPLLFHINMDPAGHGGQSGRYDRLRETAFDYAFLLWQLGVEKVGP